MDLYKEILAAILGKEEVQVIFPNLDVDGNKIVEIACYQALQKIKAVIEDDSLEDKECFMQIEGILEIFESLGSNAGSRHDFG